MSTEKTIERYEKVSEYMNNQTEEQWQKLKAYVLSTLDFEERLTLSQDEDLY